MKIPTSGYGVEVEQVSVTRSGDIITLTGAHGSCRARHDNPVEVGFAFLQVLSGHKVNPIPASCVIHEWNKKNAAD